MVKKKGKINGKDEKISPGMPSKRKGKFSPERSSKKKDTE